MDQVSLPLRTARDIAPQETINESVRISISHEVGDDIEMELVDANNDYRYHTYKVPESHRNWLDYNEWPDSASDTESTMSEDMICWCPMINGEHESHCELDIDTDEEESEEQSGDNNDDDGNGLNDSEDPSVNPDPMIGDDNLQTLQEFDVNDLKFQALMALDGKSFVSLGVIQQIIRDLSGQTLIDIFAKAAGLWSNPDPLPEKDTRKKRSDIKLALRLSAALENRDVQKYRVYFGMPSEDCLVSTMYTVLRFAQGPNDVNWTMCAMRMTNVKADKDTVSRTMRIVQMVNDTTLLIKAMRILQRKNEPKLRELLKDKLEELGAEEIYSVLGRQIWHLSKKENYQPGEEALEKFNHGGMTFPDDE